MAALNSLKSSLESFYRTLNRSATGDKFGHLSVDMANGDDDYFSVSVDENAVPNSYGVQIDQLATHHKVGVFSQSPDEEDATVPEGVYTIFVGDEPLHIEVPEDSSMGDVVNIINDHEDNPGVTASIINTEEGALLTLTADDTGKENEISIFRGGLDIDQGLEPIDVDTVQPAEDAIFYVDKSEGYFFQQYGRKCH